MLFISNTSIIIPKQRLPRKMTVSSPQYSWHREYLADLVTIRRSYEQLEQAEMLNRFMILGPVFFR